MYLVARYDFKDLAARYDVWYRTPLGALAHALEQEAIFGLADVKSGERAVDIGCGTGVYALELARTGAFIAICAMREGSGRGRIDVPSFAKGLV